MAGELGEEGGPGSEEGLLDEDGEAHLLAGRAFGENEGGDGSAEAGVACGEEGVALGGVVANLAEDGDSGAGNAVV